MNQQPTEEQIQRLKKLRYQADLYWRDNEDVPQDLIEQICEQIREMFGYP